MRITAAVYSALLFINTLNIDDTDFLSLTALLHSTQIPDHVSIDLEGTVTDYRTPRSRETAERETRPFLISRFIFIQTSFMLLE